MISGSFLCVFVIGPRGSCIRPIKGSPTPSPIKGEGDPPKL